MSTTRGDLVTVARLLEGFPGRWWLAGGWAIGAWLGGPTREHEDLEISILRRDQTLLRRHLPGWALGHADLGIGHMKYTEWFLLDRDSRSGSEA